MRRLIYLLPALCAMVLFPAARAAAEDHSVIFLSQSDRTVYDMDPVSGKVINHVQLEGVPTSAAFSWDEQWLFVSVPDQGYISFIDLRTFKEGQRLTKPEFKRSAGATGVVDALATTPDYQKLYVSVPGGIEVFNQQVLVESPEYKQPEQKISLPGKDGQYMLVHGPTNKLYYAFRNDNQVAVIDTNSDKVLKVIPVKGGPTDVTFMFGGEAWVTAADGSVSIIDIKKDEVVKTIETGGKGEGRIGIAADLRYIAATHDDSGTVSILQPVTKEVLGTLNIGKGPLSAAFAPAGHGVYHGYNETVKSATPATTQLYVAGPSGVSVVDLDKMAVSGHQDVGKGDVDALIHYTYPDGFRPPREGTATRVMETETFTLYNNAMFAYDFSGLHEHRTDMSAVVIGEGIEKIGCWTSDCPKELLTANRAMGESFEYHQNDAGTWSGVPRGTLHEEQGVSPSPRRMVIFMLKNNYYREQQMKPTSELAKIPGFKAIASQTPRTLLWSTTLVPGKPIHFPKADYAFVYLGGGLIKETHDGVPETIHKLYGDSEVDPTEKTVEAISNQIPIVVIEFR